ncbi:MAG TPA: response regulator transcription factor [Vicinamibacterales bacterium]|jgi:DNA-binding response OmpR family regulator|nr:response regulator transcription factor [Vicinamibacterales bacterium]
MPKTRILVVEDDRDLAGLVRHTLARAGDWEVEVAASGDAALRAIAEAPPDLVVLDLNLPVLDGMEVCRILRARPETRHLPIVMLTARAGEDDRVGGLELGADDYLTKPFSLRELSARVRAVLRRPRRVAERSPQVYRGASLVVDFDAVAVAVAGRAVALTRREFELLRHLVANRNRVVSRDRLIDAVWRGERTLETRSVDVHVARLRRKLGPAARHIQTVIGLGYRFVD